MLKILIQVCSVIFLIHIFGPLNAGDNVHQQGDSHQQPTKFENTRLNHIQRAEIARAASSKQNGNNQSFEKILEIQRVVSNSKTLPFINSLQN